MVYMTGKFKFPDDIDESNVHANRAQLSSTEGFRSAPLSTVGAKSDTKPARLLEIL